MKGYLSKEEFDAQRESERMAGAVMMRAGGYEHYVVGFVSADGERCCFVRQPCKTIDDVWKITNVLSDGYWDVLHSREASCWLEH